MTVDLWTQDHRPTMRKKRYYPSQSVLFWPQDASAVDDALFDLWRHRRPQSAMYTRRTQVRPMYRFERISRFNVFSNMLVFCPMRFSNSPRLHHLLQPPPRPRLRVDPIPRYCGFGSELSSGCGRSPPSSSFWRRSRLAFNSAVAASNSCWPSLMCPRRIRIWPFKLWKLGLFGSIAPAAFTAASAGSSFCWR